MLLSNNLQQRALVFFRSKIEILCKFMVEWKGRNLIKFYLCGGYDKIGDVL